MTDLTKTVERFKVVNEQQQKPYTDAWWWSADGGQRIARIMMEMMQHNDNTKAHYSHDFVVMVAKCAYEAGHNVGYVEGNNTGWDECRRRILDAI